MILKCCKRVNVARLCCSDWSRVQGYVTRVCNQINSRVNECSCIGKTTRKHVPETFFLVNGHCDL